MAFTRKSVWVLCILSLVCTAQVWAQEQTQEQDIKWFRYPSDMPVTAVTFGASEVWYTSSSKLRVVTIADNTIQKEVTQVKDIAVGEIVCMATDSSGNVWIGTEKDGIIIYKDGAFTAFAKNEKLTGSRVNCILVDRKKTVWIGTAKGVHTYKNGKMFSYTDDAHRASRAINDIDDDPQGRVWFATDDGVLCLTKGNWEIYTKETGLSYNSIHALAYDDVHGMLWTAAGEADINMYDDTTWNVYMDITSGITDIMTDTQGRVWFGGSSGLIKYNTIEWVTDAEKIGFSVARVNDMKIDPEGNMYFATMNGVIFMYNPYPY